MARFDGASNVVGRWPRVGQTNATADMVLLKHRLEELPSGRRPESVLVRRLDRALIQFYCCVCCFCHAGPVPESLRNRSVNNGREKDLRREISSQQCGVTRNRVCRTTSCR
jgi:hypothetical protein